MANFPGIYVEELPAGTRAIVGVSTSCTAFIGTSATGAVNQPVQITSFADFENRFGALTPHGELGYSIRQYFVNGGNSAWVVRIPDNPTAIQWEGGIAALDSVQAFNLLVIPGLTEPALIGSAMAYCEKRRAFLIVDAPKNKNPDDMLQWAATAAFPRSTNAAVYYPWIKITDPLNVASLRLCSPGGTIAGLFARTDGTRGVWKAPAGNDANLVGVQGLEYSLTDGHARLLGSQAINCLRQFAVGGSVCWGARTWAGADGLASEYKYVPVRRLALFLEESIGAGAVWAVLEPNGEALWSQLRLGVGAFMNTLFRQGAFQGVTPREAYFVKCDSETTTQNDISIGVVNILIGFAPLKPAEFVVIRIVLRTRAQ